MDIATQIIAGLLNKKGEGRPPVDILSIVVGLAVFAVVSFWFALLVQFSGPVVEDGISPQTVASLGWSAVGVVLGILAVLVYQRRPIGWYGTFIAAIIGVFQAVRVGPTLSLFWIVYMGIPLAVAVLLVLRRDKFLSR